MNKIIKKIKKSKRDFPGGTAGKTPPASAGDMGSILVWEDPLEKGTALTPVFWPGEFNRPYTPWGSKELDT